MARQNEIVIYQPDDTMRLEVKLADDSVWLSQEQMIELFQRDCSVISRHIRNAFQEGEVDEANCLHFLQTNQKGRPEAVYNFDCTLYSRSANKRDVQLSAARYAQQYPTKPITLVQTGKSHDRFLIIDNTTWHVGASPKDAGARIFALMKMELDPAVILGLLP